MRKRVFSLILAICLMLTAFPVESMAAGETSYGVMVGDKRFTNKNLSYTYAGGGTATYDPNTKTLTLSNLTVSTDGIEEGGTAVIYSSVEGMKIVIDGTVTVNLQKNKKDIFIAAVGIAGKNTTIVGKNGDATKDKLIINSDSEGVTTTYTPVDGVTRMGIATNSGMDISISGITVSMTDNAAGSYAGKSIFIESPANLTVTDCILQARNCQYGVYLDLEKKAVLKDVSFDMHTTNKGSGGLIFSANSTGNMVENCSGTIEAATALYTYGETTIKNSKSLKLLSSTGNGNDYAVAITQYESIPTAPSGKVTIEGGTLELQGKDAGIKMEDSSKLSVKSGSVTVKSENYAVSLADSTTLDVSGGTLQTSAPIGIYATGSDTECILSGNAEVNLTGLNNTTDSGIASAGKVDIKGGKLNVTNAAVGLFNGGSKEINISGGEHSVNAAVGIQLEPSGGKLNITNGTLNLNVTSKGIDSRYTTQEQIKYVAGKTTLSGGTVTITDTNTSSAVTGIEANGELEITNTADV